MSIDRRRRQDGMPNLTVDRSSRSIPPQPERVDASFSWRAASARLPISGDGWPLIAVLVLALSFLAFVSAPVTVGLFHDDGIYAVVAKAISEGRGYRIISLPGEPYQTKYPFLYSYLLSWAWSLDSRLPNVIALMTLLNAVFYGSVLWLAYVLYRQNSGDGKFDALLYVFLVGANASIFCMTSYSLSDIPFMAACLGCLVLAHSAERFELRTKQILLLGVGVGSAFLLRQAGAALIIAGLIHFLFSGKRKEFYLFVAVAGGLIGPWVLWRAVQGTGAVDEPLLAYYQSYESPAFFLPSSDPYAALQIVLDNLRYLLLSLDRMVLRLHVFPELRLVIYPLMLWGLVRLLRRQTLFFNGFLLFYSGLVLCWPFHPARYSMPLVPLLLLSLFLGVQAAATAVGTRSKTACSAALVPLAARLPVALVLLLTIGWLWSYVHLDRERYLPLWSGFRASYAWSGFNETFSWIEQNTQTADVLATAYDPMYFLYTGRKAVRPWVHRPETYFYPYGKAVPDLGSAEEIKEALERLGVRFLIINPLEGYSEREAAAELFQSLIRLYGDQAEIVFQSRDGLHSVYTLLPKDQ